MAETALYLALRKIRLASLEDNSSDEIGLPIFHSRLRRIEGELRMILCFLDQLETRYNSNQVLVSWIAESRRLGYLVEETVDVYIHRLFRLFPRPGRWLPGLLLTIEARRRAFIQLIELEEELQHLSKLKENWVQLATDPKREHYYIPITCETATADVSNHELVSGFTDEEPVGFDVGVRAKLAGRLQHTDEDCTIKVVAVSGPAGSGKTTVVRSVYEQQRRNFESYAWMSMSGCSSADDILTKMRHQKLLHSDGETRTSNHEHSAVTPDAVVPEKKFLVVLDDMEVTDGISQVLERMAPGSRVVIITRIDKVAEIDEDRIILSGLGIVEAEELFARVVFGKGTQVSAEQIRNRYKIVMGRFPGCSSLPQVIVSLGATLRWNQSTESAFQHVQDQLEWVSKYNSSLDDTRRCLYVAYINLPMHLKVCLLYCGVFPAGYLLQREKLVRLWVAEGFVKKQRESQVEEDIAEGYVTALTSWGFLQHAHAGSVNVSVPAGAGRVGANLRMPAIVHDLVYSVCRKEGFGIASQDVELGQEDASVRCLFTSKYPRHIRSLTHLPHLRTLIVSEEAAALPDPSHSGSAILEVFFTSMAEILAADLTGSRPQRRRRFSYLTVLELHGSPLENVPAGIDRLFNLRYLGLSKTKVAHLPSSIKKLHNLQTLDVEATNVTQLPDWIHKLARLRHILAGRCAKGVRAWKSVIKLKELQTLETVQATADFTNSAVGLLTQVRSIGISEVETRNSKTLCLNLSRLGSLCSLAVSASDVSVVLPISSLTLEQLKSLELSTCRLEEDAVQLLAKNLINLVSLTLNNVSGITNLKFENNQFTKLRALKLQGVHDVTTLQIPQDALANLQVLHVKSCTELRMVGHHAKITSVKDLFIPNPEVPARNELSESSS